MFTIRDTYESVLTELNKKSAPSFSREEFAYLCNKASLFISNDGYKFYAMNGRLSDEYRFLKKSLDIPMGADVPVITLLQEVVSGDTEFSVSGSGLSIGDKFYISDNELVVESIVADGLNWTITSTSPYTSELTPVITIEYLDVGTVTASGPGYFGMDSMDMPTGTVVRFSEHVPTIDHTLTAGGYVQFGFGGYYWRYDTDPTVPNTLNNETVYKKTDVTTYQDLNPIPSGTVIEFTSEFKVQKGLDALGNSEVKILLSDDDYFHTLLCSVYLKGKTTSGQDAMKRFVAKRLKEDNEGAIYDNVFMNPKYTRHYYDISNALDHMLPFKTSRNSATVEVKVGKLPDGINIETVIFEYLKLPAIIEVTDEDIYGTGSDTSQALEFPETLRTKFISKVTEYLLEYTNNPRTQTLPQISADLPPVPMELLMATPANNTQQ